MWILLHGLGQLASVFITYFEVIATPGRLVVAPEALNRYYVARGPSGGTKDAQVGATWMTREDRENEIADQADFLDGVWREVASGASRVTLVGFSQGVATACRWISSGRSRVDRFIAWAGQLSPDVDPSAYRGLRDGLVLVAGSRDEYAGWIAEGDHEARLEEAGVQFEVVGFEGGHRMDKDTLVRIAG